MTRERFLTIRAWMVHFYTSLGIIAALLALTAIFKGSIQEMVVFLAIANIIDATDGALARHWNVKRFAASFDGRKLDDIIDYINYTFLPVFFCYRFGLVLETAGVVVLGVVLIFSIYGFCNQSAKTSDGFFTGFPNFWNVLVVYLYLFGFSPEVNTLILLFFALMIWVPIKYVSFSTVPFRRLTILMSIVYAIISIIIVITFNRVDMRLVWLSLIGPIYYFAISFYLHFKEQRLSALGEISK